MPSIFATARLFIGATGLALALAGCAATGIVDDPYLSPEQRQLRTQAQRFNETVATGAIGGCLVGAAIGALVNRNITSVAIGCGAGAAAGLVAGHYVASRNQQYANAEDALNGRISAANQEIQDYQAIAQSSEILRIQNLQRIAQLKSQVRSGQLSAQQYQAQAASIQQDVEILRRAVSECDKTQAEITADLNSPQLRGMPTGQLARARSQLYESRDRINRNADAMVAALGA